MSVTFAVSGKGGTGKSTFSAMLVRQFVERGKTPVMAIDADPNSTLADMLGIHEINGYVSDIRERTTGSEGERLAGMSKDRTIEYLLAETVTEGTGFDLLVMGQPEGPSCYCFVNNVLRRYMDALAKDYPFMVLDNEAGMEHLSRRTTNNVDHLFLISEPTVIGVRTAGRIRELTKRLPIKISAFHLVVNKVPASGLTPEVKDEIGKIDVMTSNEIPLDENIYKEASVGGNVFDYPTDSQAYTKAGEILDGALLEK